MIPVLFSENSQIFTTTGIGGLSDAMSCICTEERNGQYELELVYPVTGKRFSDIAINTIIAVIPFDGGTRQGFRVYSISKPISGQVTINARHISYQLTNIPCMPFSVTASSTACNETLQKLKRNAVESCPFTFWTDVVTGASYEQKTPASIRSRLGGIDGSVLDQFGGEYEWDNWTVKFHKQRGADNGVTLRYGKNITDIKQEENIASTVTGVVPFWIDMEGENLVTISEKAVYSQYAENYPYHLTVPYDLSGSYQEKPTEAAIRSAARAYVNKTGLGIPKVSIEVSFIALWQTEEYKDIAPLQRVKLCDTVTIEFEKLGISAKAKVVKTEYDVLAERYRSIQIGNVRSSLAETLNDQNTQTFRTIDGKTMQLQGLIDNATAWMTSSAGYVVAIRREDGSWGELLFLDTPDVDAAVNVLRINENGIGFSTNGVNGPYNQAWTLDGNLLIGGTGAPSLTVYDKNQNIIFQATKDGIIWNATNSSMDITGKLTIRAADIVSKGTDKSVTIVDGQISSYDADEERLDIDKAFLAGYSKELGWGQTGLLDLVPYYGDGKAHVALKSNNTLHLQASNTISLEAGSEVRVGNSSSTDKAFSGTVHINGSTWNNLVFRHGILVDGNYA